MASLVYTAEIPTAANLTASSTPSEKDNKPSMLPVDLDALLDNVKCSICMGMLRNTHAVSVCMHRFCKACIERWLRSQRGNNCPQCRVEFSSRRDCRPDPQFDHLLRILFGDLDAFEEVIAPAASVLERAKAVGLQLLKAQEQRKQRPQHVHPGLQHAPFTGNTGDAIVHLNTLPASSNGKQTTKQQQASSKRASPSISAGLKRSQSRAVQEDTKRLRVVQSVMVSPSGTKYRGVRLTNGRYQARVKYDGREVSLGHYESAQDAAKAYDMEQLRRHGAKASLNLPHLRSHYQDMLLKEGGGLAAVAAAAAAVSDASPSAAGSMQQAPQLSGGSGRPEDDAAEKARLRAMQLAQQYPMRAAFNGVNPIAHIRLEAAGSVRWDMKFLACPANVSVGQLKQTMSFGIIQQHGTAVLNEPLRLAVQNDLDSSANFDAICTTDADGSLLLRDHLTIRDLLMLLEDCTEELVLEYSC